MADKKVVQLEDRIPKLKAERKQKANRRFIIYITLFFLLALTIIYFKSPLSDVRTITVQGNHFVDVSTIKESSGVTTRSKIWDIDEENVGSMIEDIPMIKSATVSSNFPSTVVIKVKEHQRIAYLKSSHDYYPILSNGELMEKVAGDRLPIDAPILIGFEKGKVLTALADQLIELDPPLIHSISEIDYVSNRDDSVNLILYMGNGNEVWANIGSLAKKMTQFYPSILSTLKEDQKGVIDLSVGATFKPYKDLNKGDTPHEEE